MRSLLAGAAALTLMAGSSGMAMAQAASQDVIINATVPLFCTIGGSATGSALAPVVVPVSSLGVVNTTTLNTSQANVTCNQKTHIDLTSLNGGVTGPASPPSGFTNKIHYTASAGVGVGTNGTLDTSGPTPGQGDTGAAFAGQTLSISITPQTPSAPLVNGAYTDTLTVTLTPFV